MTDPIKLQIPNHAQPVQQYRIIMAVTTKATCEQLATTLNNLFGRTIQKLGVQILSHPRLTFKQLAKHLQRKYEISATEAAGTAHLVLNETAFCTTDELDVYLDGLEKLGEELQEKGETNDPDN